MSDNLKAITESLDNLKTGFEEFKENSEKEKAAKAEEEEKKAAEAKAEEDEEKKAAEAKAKAGVRPAGGGVSAKGSGAVSGFMDSVNEKKKLGMSRPQAVAQTVHEDPELHREFVQGVNAGR